MKKRMKSLSFNTTFVHVFVFIKNNLQRKERDDSTKALRF